MRDIGEQTDENRNRITTWLFLLVMRLYGQNIYSDESYIWKVLEMNDVKEIDVFFSSILADFKFRKQDVGKFLKAFLKEQDIQSR
jgi:hypothetical protein